MVEDSLLLMRNPDLELTVDAQVTKHLHSRVYHHIGEGRSWRHRTLTLVQEFVSEVAEWTAVAGLWAYACYIDDRPNSDYDIVNNFKDQVPPVELLILSHFCIKRRRSHPLFNYYFD